MSSFVSFEGWTIQDAVIALWSAARVVRVGDKPTPEQIQRILQTQHGIDYLNGRSLKLGTLEDWPMVDSALYNRDNGDQKMQDVSSRCSDTNIDMLAANPLVAQKAKEFYTMLFE